MRFRYYQGARGGIGSALAAIGGASAGAGGTYNDTLRMLAGVDQAKSSAEKSRAETRILDDQMYGREGFGGELENMPMPEGMTPKMAEMAFRASKDPSLKDFFAGLQGAQNIALQRRAVEAGTGTGEVPPNIELANLLNVTRRAGETYQPFRGGDFGTVNQATGEFNPSGANLALATDRNASARAHDAAAGASDALARQRGVLEVAPGASVFSVADFFNNLPAPDATQAGGHDSQWNGAPFEASQQPEAPQGLDIGSMLNNLQPPAMGVQPMATAPGKASAAGGDKPTTNSKKYDELRKLGVPEEAARGVAYGTLKQVRDSNGQFTALVDVATGRVVGTLTKNPNNFREPIWTPNTPGAPASPATPPAAAPSNDPLGIR